jgi:hypothetical protein
MSKVKPFFLATSFTKLHAPSRRSSYCRGPDGRWTRNDKFNDCDPVIQHLIKQIATNNNRPIIGKLITGVHFDSFSSSQAFCSFCCFVRSSLVLHLTTSDVDSSTHRPDLKLNLNASTLQIARMLTYTNTSCAIRRQHLL